MKLVKRDTFYFILLLLISVLFISDIFFHPGKSETFDATTHATTIAQYFLALKSGDFPVVWLGGFANYGLPIGIVAHQLPNYLGALITFITQDPFLSLMIVAFIGIFLSNVFYYFFLRFYFQPDVAFVGAFFFNFTSYRITNFYVRGAIPELFSNMFLPLILIAITLFIKRRDIGSLLLLMVSIAALTLTHPMMLFIYSFVIVPYVFFQLFMPREEESKLKVTILSLLGIAAMLSVGVGSYYVLPLLLESKYFYFGLSENHLAANSFLTLKNFLDVSGFRFDPSEIYTRGNTISVGVLNIVVILIGSFLLLYQFLRKNTTKQTGLLLFAVLLSYLLICFTMSFSNSFYQMKLFNSIQFPWRILSSFIFLPPLILCILLSKWQNKYLFLLCIAIISIFSFPQLFGKDYQLVNKGSYYFSIYNSHSVMMNTIWTGKTEEYPVKKEKPEIVEGEGSILSQKIENSEREYKIGAQTPLRMVDHTFYFPGWKLFIDSKEAPIEFQDPKYRGVITYRVEPGIHTVALKFMQTKIRTAGMSLSGVCLIGSVFFIFLFSKLRRRLFVT